MDTLTLLAIVLGVLAVLVAVIVLRRSWGSPFDRSVNPLPLDVQQPKPPARASSAALSSQDLAGIRALLAGGNKIEAIKRVRELTGLGLKEAKDYVDAMPLAGPLPVPPRSAAAPAGAGDVAEVHALAQQGRKIEAIKRYRELTGVGLKEAKDYVDRL